MAKLYYFQGFDIHAYVGDGFNAGGNDDAATEWFGGTPTRLGYSGGYDRGQSIYVNRWTGISWSALPGLRPNEGRVCATGWFKLSGTSGDGTRVNLWEFKYLASTGIPTWQYYYLRHQPGDPAGDLGVYHNSTLLGRVGNLPAAIFNQYGFLELSVDQLNGEVRVRNDGAEYLFSIPVNITSGVWDIATGGNRGPGDSGTINTGANYYLDHVTISDSRLPQNGVLGVAVLGSSDRFESVNQFRGGLIIGGERYQTSYRNSAQVSSLGEAGRNVANTLTFLFPQNPATGQDWTTAGFRTIESWGLCHELFNSAGAGDRTRLMAMALSWIDGNGGQPLVKYQAPSQETFFSGPWVKTDPLKTFTSHVNQVPRPATPLVADATYLTIDNPGCLYFKRVEEEVPVVSVVGITFAEERRADYNEWQDIIGDALPFKSWFTTGYNVLAEGNKPFQSNYVTVNYVPLPFGSAYIQGLWDYAQTGDTGRWSSRQQIYSNSDTRYSNRMRKLKIRGQGNALQMRVTSEDNKPFSINGWTMAASSNGAV